MSPLAPHINLFNRAGGSLPPAAANRHYGRWSLLQCSFVSERWCAMFQPGLLKDRAIFLTGGGSGLGRSMAIHFAKLGARLFVVGRREEPLKSTCDEIHRDGGAAAYPTCDVPDFSSLPTSFSSAPEPFPQIHSP